MFYKLIILIIFLRHFFYLYEWNYLSTCMASADVNYVLQIYYPKVGL